MCPTREERALLACDDHESHFRRLVATTQHCSLAYSIHIPSAVQFTLSTAPAGTTPLLPPTPLSCFEGSSLLSQLRNRRALGFGEGRPTSPLYQVSYILSAIPSIACPYNRSDPFLPHCILLSAGSLHPSHSPTRIALSHAWLPALDSSNRFPSELPHMRDQSAHRTSRRNTTY